MCREQTQTEPAWHVQFQYIGGCVRQRFQQLFLFVCLFVCCCFFLLLFGSFVYCLFLVLYVLFVFVFNFLLLCHGFFGGVFFGVVVV